MKELDANNPLESDLLAGGDKASDSNGALWHVWETQYGRDGVARCLCYNFSGVVTVIPRHQLKANFQ